MLTDGCLINPTNWNYGIDVDLYYRIIFIVHYFNEAEDESFKHSDTSDDERESDLEQHKLSMSMTESIPNSPASFCQRSVLPAPSAPFTLLPLRERSGATQTIHVHD